MKKLFVIPLMFIYLLTVSGVMIHAHYCGDDLESLTINTKTDGCADGECGDESQENDGCCKDKVVTAKVSQDQNLVVSKLKLFTLGIALLPTAYTPCPVAVLPAAYISAKAHRGNAPPGLWQNIALYKLHARFTYYG